MIAVIAPLLLQELVEFRKNSVQTSGGGLGVTGVKPKKTKVYQKLTKKSHETGKVSKDSKKESKHHPL